MAELRAPEQNRLLGQLANMLRATEGDIAAPEFLPRGLDVMGLVRQLMLPSAETVEKLSYGDPLFRMPTQSNIPITADREYLAEVLGMAPAVPAASRATTRLSNEAADALVRAITRNPEATAPQVLEAAGEMLPMSRITTYHGSPYLFRQFDPARVGTGEGAQAYGVGSGYTAEARPVAEEYRRATTKDRFATQEGVFEPSSLEHLNVKATLRKDGLEKAIEVARKSAVPDEDYPEVVAKAARDLEVLEKLKKSGGIQPVTGYLYKGEIPDEILPSFLDWDKKFADQTPQVKEAIKKYWDDNNVFGDPTKLNGEGIYDSIVAHVYSDVGRLQSQKAASEELEKAGVLGIRYFDEKSRGSYKAQLTYKGQPYSDVVEFKTKQQLDDYIKESNEKGFGVQTFPQTSNFVTFRPEDYRIQEINDRPVGEFFPGLLDQPAQSVVENPLSAELNALKTRLDELNNQFATGTAPPSAVREHGAVMKRYQELQNELFPRAQTTPAEVADETAQGLLDTSYRGGHSAPSREFGAQLHQLDQIFPDDIYSPQAARNYGHYGGNDPMDRQTIRLAQSLRGKPDADVTIYRAVPKDEKIKDINQGDWVTINKQYAKEHGESVLLGDYKILEKKVKAKDIWTNADSIHEYGYDPD